jgi:hypothetical protein
MGGKGQKNSRSLVSDLQALHIKQIRFVQMPDEKIGKVIKYIQKFYDLKYKTIYNIIYFRYRHLDELY